MTDGPYHVQPTSWPWASPRCCGARASHGALGVGGFDGRPSAGPPGKDDDMENTRQGNTPPYYRGLPAAVWGAALDPGRRARRARERARRAA